MNGFQHTGSTLGVDRRRVRWHVFFRGQRRGRRSNGGPTVWSNKKTSESPFRLLHRVTNSLKIEFLRKNERIVKLPGSSKNTYSCLDNNKCDNLKCL